LAVTNHKPPFSSARQQEFGIQIGTTKVARLPDDRAMRAARVTVLRPKNDKEERDVIQKIRGVQVVALAILVALAGCAAPHSDLLYRDRKMLSQEKGLVVASLGYKTAADGRIRGVVGSTSLHVGYKALNDPSGQEYVLTTLAHMRAFGAWQDSEVVREGSGTKRVLVGYSLKPGRYVLTKQRVELYGFATWTATPRLAAPLEFEVKPNSITYVGAHEVETRSGENLLGMAVPANVTVRVLDEMEEDMSLLYRVRPELQGMPVFDALVQ
jgi:hypothetical protein